MDSPKLKIIWREWEHLPECGFGHGVEFHDCEIDESGQSFESIVGFLEGFGWKHGDSNEVVIYCIKPNARTPQTELSRMKKRVEELLAERKLPNNQITPRISA